MAEPVRDLGLDLPLHGVQRVEASAGTGKTYTLATLVLRLVIERRLPVDTLLAVTFTEAATAELRTRLRERLAAAARLAETLEGDEAATPDATHALVLAALHDEPRDSLVARLRLAAEAMDLAPVMTIHGFCQRALAEHALEAGLPPGDIELVGNESALRLQVATDLWREVSADAAAARDLLAHWDSPEQLAATLRDLDGIDELRPPADAPAAGEDTAAREALCESAAAVAAGFAAHGADTDTEVRRLQSLGALSGTSHGARSTVPAWLALSAWVDDACRDAPADDRVALFGTKRLEKAINKKFVDREKAPANSLTDAIARWFERRDAVVALDRRRRVALLHHLRDEGARRLDALKRERRQQGFGDLITRLAQALAGPRGEALAQRLRAQYRVALLDEFQDTDPEQWAIFRRVFAQAPDDGEARALFLIGDPKQAIYRFRGGDVHTYLAATADVHATWRLERNFRSRPRVLQAIEALYSAAGETPFGEVGVPFVPVAPAGKVTDGLLHIDGAIAPGLVLQTWDADDAAKERKAETRARAVTACVATLAGLLEPGRAQVGDDRRALRPGDIAVLVQVHDQARDVLRALAAAGVPAVAVGRDSLYATDEARDLLTLLEACLHLADDSRLRAALATPLLGQDAVALARLDDDDATHRHWQDQALAWRQRWERHGPLPLVLDLCAANAPRLLERFDGERVLGNWLQLAEALQAEASAHPPARQVEHLQQRLADADDRNQDEQLRLASDADRVRVLTLHASKGLEFPLVFLPFQSELAGGAGRGDVHRFHEGMRRVAWLRHADDTGAEHAKEREAAEEAAERLRLLYVGLTRAKLATWVGFGPGKQTAKTPLAATLFADRDMPAKGFTAAEIGARLQALAAVAPEAVRIEIAADRLPPPRTTAATAIVLPPAPVPTRTLSRDWWVHSFSGLSQEAGVAADERGAADETDPPLAPTRFAGPRFGNVLHAALEGVDFAAWRGALADVPDTQHAVLAQALRDGGYGSTHDQAEGVPLLAALVHATLTTTLPEGTRLADLPPEHRRAEMEFHFPLHGFAADTLLARLQQHGAVRQRQAFGTRQRLEGLMTGFIDLVYEHAGRFYVLDYKSNLLPAYDAATLAAAIADSEYDLQYLLYTVALHRWLRFRRPGYDYDRHFGGVRYLFCRGLQPGDAAMPGVHAVTPPRALVESLDALFGGTP